MRNQRLFVIVSCLLIVIFTLGTLLSCNSNNFKTSSNTITQIGSGQLAKYYKSVDELLTDSDLVVIGTFNNSEIFVPTNDEAPYFPGWRELTFNIEETIKGVSTTNVQVAQHASSNSNEIIAGNNDTLFLPGDRYILFLTKETHYKYEFYWLTGAIQGAFRIKDGKLYSRNILGEIPQEIGPVVDGISLDQFIQDIKN